MVGKKKFSHKIFDYCNGILLVILMMSTLYPFLYVIFASLSDSDLLMAHKGMLLKPIGFSVEAYKAVLANPQIYSGYRNTIFVVIFGTIVNIVMTSMGAYVLSKKTFYFRSALNTMVVITMFFSGGLIPNFLLVKGMGLYNSLWALIIPGAISTWNLMIMRTSFEAIPESLIESAKIDGASEFTVLFKIVIPLSMATIAVMTLWYGVGHWNAWFSAMIYLRKRELYPLQLILREILISNNTDSMLMGESAGEKASISATIIYATIMVATLPILLVYPFLQKYFVKGVMVGAVKG